MNPFCEVGRIAVLGIVVCLLSATCATAQSIPPDVKTALEQYASLDPISFEWKGKIIVNAWGKHDEIAIESSYLRQGKNFAWMKAQTSSNGKAGARTCRFNGEVVAAANDKHDASWYLIAKLLRKQPKARRFDLEYFEAVGIYCPTQLEDFSEGVLQSNILYLIDHGGDLVSAEETWLGQETVVRIEIVAENPAWDEASGQKENEIKFETDRLNSGELSQEDFDKIRSGIEERTKATPRQLRWVYYLGPKERFAVRRHERLTMDGKVTASYSNIAFLTVPGTDIVLAETVKKKSFEMPTRTGYQILDTAPFTTELSVVDVSTKPIPGDRFVLNKEEIAPGAIVIDATSPELQNPDETVITFKMPASPEDLDAAIAAASAQYMRPPERPWIRYGLIVVNIIVILVGVYFVARRRATSRRDAT